MANTRIVNLTTQAIPQPTALHTQRTISSTAVPLINHTLKAGTQHVRVQFTGADARVTYDGVTAPTSTRGFLYTNGTILFLTKIEASKALAIRNASTDVVAEIQELNFL
jgi:hypothetical protein